MVVGETHHFWKPPFGRKIPLKNPLGHLDRSANICRVKIRGDRTWMSCLEVRINGDRINGLFHLQLIWLVVEPTPLKTY